MARAYKQPSIVSGKSINDIMNMDIDTFNKLNKRDLQKVVGRLVSAGNKRLRSFEKAGESSPATRHVMKSGGVFSTRGKDVNELRAEYIRAKNFIQSKTGNRKGWKEVKKKTITSLEKKGIKLNDEQFNKFWESYEDLKEMDTSVSNKGLKYNIMRDIADLVVDETLTADEIALKLNDEISNIYEKNAGVYEDEFTGISGLFE